MRITSLLLSSIGLAGMTIAAPGIVSAQEESPADAEMLTPEQQSAYDQWSPDQKLAYGTWPSETRSYYWSLSNERQELFWRLSPANKVQLSGMAPVEQESAWAEIEAQAKAAKKAPGDQPKDMPPVE